MKLSRQRDGRKTRHARKRHDRLHPPAPTRRDRRRDVGPKAANLAPLARAGLPTPGGFALTAAAYRHQLRHLGIEDVARAIQRRRSAELSANCRCKSGSRSISSRSRRRFSSRCSPPGARSARTAPLGAVRSSALIEDRKGANFAGQFESFLGLTDETEFLTAVRACWAALWTSHARRYMDNHDLSPADTAMARADPAAGRGARLRRRPKRNRGRPDADFRDLGPRLGASRRARWCPTASCSSRTASCARSMPAARAIATPARTASRRRELVPKDMVQRAVPVAGRGGHARPPAAQMRAACRRPGRDRMGDGRARLQAAAVAAAACRGADRARRDLAAASGPQRPSRRHRLGLGPRGGGAIANANLRASRPATFWSRKVAGPVAQPHPAARRGRGGRARRLDLASRVARARARHSHGARRARRDPQRFPTARNARSTASPASCGGCGERQAAHLRHPADRRRARSSGCASSARVKINPDASRIIAKPKLIAAVKQCRHPVLACCTTRSTAPWSPPIRSCARSPRNGDHARQHRRRRSDQARHSGHGGAADRGGGDRRSCISA